MGIDSVPDPDACPTASGMPMLGLGTWNHSDTQCIESVRTALETGYRHVDTAQMYDNESAVGEGIARADVDREEIFLATKITPANLSGEDVRRTARESIDRLDVEYVDLLYIHWPAREYDPEETLTAFSELYDRGLIDNVGVSNFEPAQLETAIDICDAPIFANQIELHPFCQQERLRSVCESLGIELVAYSPLAKGEAVGHPKLESIAEKHAVSEAQVALAWLRQIGATAIPKATGGDHIRDNWASLELELDADDMAAIEAIERTNRTVDPAFAPWN